MTNGEEPSATSAAEEQRSKSKHTPVMQQFLRAKELYPDAIVFFRLGDFYEMFFDDAIRAASMLDIAQTYRGKTPNGERIPMAGVPHHSATGYITRLLALGQKVAICEQMADPSTVKGVVPREVVRVITPGLCLEPDALDARTDNYLVAVTEAGGRFGLAALELSLGQLRACEVAGEAALLAEIVRLEPRELLLPDGCDALAASLRESLPSLSVRSLAAAGPGVRDPDGTLARAVPAEEAERLRREVPEGARAAAAAALAYAIVSQPGHEVSVQRLGVYDPSSQLTLDETAVRNLELVRTLAGERRGSLLHLLDATRTPMGARELRRRLLAPLTDVAGIRRRHDAVEAFVLDVPLRAEVRGLLAEIGDLERLATRASLGVATPRDLGGIRDGLAAAAALGRSLANERAAPLDDAIARALPGDLCDDVQGMLQTALVPEPPLVDRAGGIVAPGIHAELDELRGLSENGKDLVLAMERAERERTGIASLKIKFTRVFGYYIEITRSNLAAVPPHYIRKQTVANAERFVTEELKELEEKILHADERARALEHELFTDLRLRVARESNRLRALASAIASVDVHASLAEAAHRFGYVRPVVDEGLAIELQEGRHPIVEQLAASGAFVPNDLRLDARNRSLVILTGPNMAGKSTVMRQVALAVIMAQMGSFVPATEARVGVVDRVFTRVGASDNLGQGQSTFMVEMRETATILREATHRSLVILDEIGRGTSTYDGLSIAWAVAEHLHDAVGCRTIFATHYHELCELARTHAHAVNMNVAAKEYGDDVVFLHKLVEGGANRSYGIAVARLAGVHPIVLARAKALLADLEAGSTLPSGTPARMRALDAEGRAQLELFAGAAPPATPSEVERTLRELDVDHLTPVEALVALARLRAMLTPSVTTDGSGPDR